MGTFEGTRAAAPKGKKSRQIFTAKEEVRWEAKILNLPEYGKLDDESKKTVGQIIQLIRKVPVGVKKYSRLYFFEHLETALTTPFKGKKTADSAYGCSPEQDRITRERLEHVFDRKKWLIWRPDDTEDEVAKAKKFQWALSKRQNRYFMIDASDLNHLLIKVKIKLSGDSAEDVEKIKLLEHDIQKACSTEGYRVDIVFVDKTDFDVFEFKVEFCEWPNSGNWSSGPYTLSHELHHALNLDDRYDYIEDHSDNDKMDVSQRIYLFLEQMKRGVPSKRDAYSKMGQGWRTLLSEDICKVAFESERFQHANTPEEMAACLKVREKFDPPGIPPRP
jgi:hypothetical protein